jgi:hypothetical protein
MQKQIFLFSNILWPVLGNIQHHTHWVPLGKMTGVWNWPLDDNIKECLEVYLHSPPYTFTEQRLTTHSDLTCFIHTYYDKDFLCTIFPDYKKRKASTAMACITYLYVCPVTSFRTTTCSTIHLGDGPELSCPILRVVRMPRFLYCNITALWHPGTIPLHCSNVHCTSIHLHEIQTLGLHEGWGLGTFHQLFLIL